MLRFDAPTAFVFAGCLYVLLPVVTWFTLADQRNRQVDLWCAGGLLMGLAVIMAGTFSNAQGGFLALGVGLGFLGHSLRLQSLRLDLGRPWPNWLLLALPVSGVLIFSWLHFVVEDFVWRAVFNSALNGGLLFYLGLLAARIGRREQSRNARWIALGYVLAGLFLLARVPGLLLQTQSGLPHIANEGLLSLALPLVFLLSGVLGHFGYVGLALDRASRRELEAVEARVRDEENRRLGGQIAQLDRQRSLGELSASLGHELNQPLASILTNVQVVRRGLESGRLEGERVFGFLEKIEYNTRRASQIIDRIRGFIRPSTACKAPVELNALVREVSELVADEARTHRVKFIFPEPAEAVWVSGDAIQLSQIVLNVLRNAIEALTEVARREIRINCRVLDGRAMLTIEDSGPGLAPGSLEQVGTPFFTTKPAGLGMGLSISRTIAQQHQGHLRIGNRPAASGSGVVVELDLPSLEMAHEA